MKRVYIFSGLGADERVFQKLRFPGCDPVFIRWIAPERDEDMTQYAQRISKQIADPDPVLIGLSFGGMMAVEVAKQIKPSSVILIASAKSRNEIPMMYRLAGKVGIIKLLPANLLKQSNFFTNWLFGIETNEDNQLLKQILIDTDPKFLKWAMRQIIRWKQTETLPNVVHIHGTKDRILPYNCVKSDVTVRNGGHFMTMNKAEEINAILASLLL